jgi:hypothetical protein
MLGVDDSERELQVLSFRVNQKIYVSRRQILACYDYPSCTLLGIPYKTKGGLEI